MARSARGVFGEIGGMARGVGASYTAKSTKRGVRITGSVTKKTKPKTESTSYRGSELSKRDRKQIASQNKAAESMKSKDLDRVESAKAGAQTRKRNQRRREAGMYAKGAVAGATVTVGATAVTKDKKKKKK
jgi:hypothetical protein